MEGIQVKINQSGFYYCCCLFSKSHIVHTQNTQSKMYSPNPRFSATGSIQHQISKAVGSADTDFSSVPWSSSPSGHPAVRFKTCPSSFSLPGSSEPRLRFITQEPCNHLQLTSVGEEFKIMRWMKWQDLYCWWDSLHSKWTAAYCVLRLCFWTPWSYWVIISSLRPCDFVRCLKRKVINILETFPDKLENQMAAQNLWNAD